MPISRREFELGGPSAKAFLQALFEETPDVAYGFSEIMAKLRSRSIELESDQVQDILEHMEEDGIIESREDASGERTYIYKRRRLGFARPEG